MASLATRLIALDWGTSSLRAYRLGSAGEVLEARRSGSLPRRRDHRDPQDRHHGVRPGGVAGDGGQLYND